MKKKLVLLICVLGLMFGFSNIVMGDEVIETDDAQLLEALLQHDANSDGKVQKSEVPKYLVLDGYKIKSVECLKGISFSEISMIACGLNELPEGMEDLDYTVISNVYLNDNNLSNLDEIRNLLQTKIYPYVDYSRWLHLDGNPVYDEVIDYVFNEFYYNLSIVGIEGNYSWQKLENRHNLKVDDMDLGSFNDEFQTYFTVNTKISELGEWVYEIEDPSIAEIVGTKEIKRSYIADSSRKYKNYLQTDDVLEIHLLKSGYTRMKISSGAYVKYVDIWVLPSDSEENGIGVFAIPSISEPKMGAYILNMYGVHEYSGMINCEKFLTNESFTVNGDFYDIKDFTTFSLNKNIQKIRLLNYTDEMLDSIIGVENITTLEELEICANDQQKNEFIEFVDACEPIREMLGDEFSIISNESEKTVVIKRNDGEVSGDVDSNGIIDANDALLILKHAARVEILSDNILIRVDMNKDTNINADDALIILQSAAKITE